MDKPQQIDSSGRDRNNSCYDDMKASINPNSALATHREMVCDDRWSESQLEEPERWDGMS